MRPVRAVDRDIALVLSMPRFVDDFLARPINTRRSRAEKNGATGACPDQAPPRKAGPLLVVVLTAQGLACSDGQGSDWDAG